MRDSFKNRLYAAERAWELDYPAARARVSVEDVFDIYGALARRYKRRRPEIVVNPAMKRHAGLYTAIPPRVTFDRNDPTTTTVLHEWAHHMTNHHASHGGAYCEAMLKVVRAHLGDIGAERLAEAYTNAGLDITAEAERERHERAAARLRRKRAMAGQTDTVYLVGYAEANDPGIDGEDGLPDSIFLIAEEGRSYVPASARWHASPFRSAEAAARAIGTRFRRHAKHHNLTVYAVEAKHDGIEWRPVGTLEEV